MRKHSPRIRDAVVTATTAYFLVRLAVMVALAVAALPAIAPACGMARASIPLQKAFDNAGPGGGYDKVVVLEPGQVYTGGLFIGPVLSLISVGMEGPPGMDVLIQGNGAILDLEGGQICISYCNNRLDIEDCVILNGNIRFRGLRTAFHDVVPFGSVRHVTFYRPYDYGIRLQGSGAGILLERNLVVDAVDTGYDFHWGHGAPHEWLPTGTCIAFSVQAGQYGVPQIRENWSFHTDPERNDLLLAHYSILCEHG